MRASDPVKLLAALIRCPSVTPKEAGSLTVLEQALTGIGFAVDRILFEEAGTEPVENLYARLGTDGPHLMFAGHTDVVPEGDAKDWSHPPFAAEIDDGLLFGRGAVDMKGSIACFIAAIARHIDADGPPPGSMSLLITGDEEGVSINGTEKLLQWAAQRGERWDACIVGEPSNSQRLGDMIKVGRRGSLNGRLVVHGTQGHVAYPHRADNPVRALLPLLGSLLDPALDQGSAHFSPTNLEIASIDIGNPVHNVIPARATATLNIRFSDLWTAESLKAEIDRRLQQAAHDDRYRPGREPAHFAVDWMPRSADVFLTHDERLIETVRGAAQAVTGLIPDISTTGGTSDARFVKDYCPVVEFGLVSQTMHQVDERVSLADLDGLTAVYGEVIRRWFDHDNAGA